MCTPLRRVQAAAQTAVVVKALRQALDEHLRRKVAERGSAAISLQQHGPGGTLSDDEGLLAAIVQLLREV